MNFPRQYLFNLILLHLIIVIGACNIKSNSLPQADAEKSIHDFLIKNPFETDSVSITDQSIVQIGMSNIYAESRSNIKVDFQNRTGKKAALLFEFMRDHDNNWFLVSVEVVEKTSAELNRWSEDHKKIRYPVEKIEMPK